MIQAFVNGRFTGNYPITEGMDTFHKTILVDGRPIKIGFVDTPGLWDYDRFRPMSYDNTDAFLLCFSIVEPDSFSNVREKVSY